MDDHLSITSPPTPRLAADDADRTGLLTLICPLSVLLRAFRREDWILVTLCVVLMGGIVLGNRFGQRRDRRTLSQRVGATTILLIAGALVLFAKNSAWRAIGVAICPVPYLIDIAIARRAQAVESIAADQTDRSRYESC